MTSELRIAEVARRSGFSAATIRYYEEIGLLPAPPRTPSGYRSYDETILGRLAFIARAKQLGCTLDEIADLAIAWDGGQCGPVQDRLRLLLAAKQTDAQARVVELMTLTADLQRAAALLERHRPDGPCDERCGCLADPDPDGDLDASCTTTVQLTAGPAARAEVPIACTLDRDEMQGRLDDWQRVLRHVISRSPADGGVRLVLDAATPVDELVRLAAAEHGCCQFFAFAVTLDQRGIGLEVRAPGDARDLVDALFGVAS